MLNSKIFKRWLDRHQVKRCKSDAGEYSHHCFHWKEVAETSCLEGKTDLKQECCRCGFIRDMPFLA